MYIEVYFIIIYNSFLLIFQGTPKMTSTAHLIVLLLDINDNPPEFEHSLYEQTVPEDTPLGNTIMRVFATSKDTGVNAEISYAIIGGNEQGKFRVDSSTGVLAISEELDYEAVKEYMLTIQANDGGTPSLSNTAIVKINITDANDNTPVFAQAVYQSEVAENAQVGTNIIQVQTALFLMSLYSVIACYLLGYITVLRLLPG